VKVESVLPAQPMQAAIAALRTDPDLGQLYVDSRTVEVPDGLDVDALRQAWQDLYRDTEALRSRVVRHGDRFLVVVDGDPAPPLHEGVDARSRSVDAVRGILRSLVAQHAARVAAADRVALAHVRGDYFSLVTLTWRHEVLDGTGVATVLDELRSRMGGRHRASTGSLVDAARAVQAQPSVEVSRELGEPPGRLHTFGRRASGSVLTVKHTIDGSHIARAAALHSTTRGVVLTTALAVALAEVGGSDGFMLSVEDCRPADVAGVPGVFSGLSAVWRPIAAVTWADAVRRVHHARGTVQGRRPVPLGELLQPVWEASAVGAPDVILTIHPSGGTAGDGAGWRTVQAIEQTEFAMSLDVLLDDEDVALHVHRDPARVAGAIVSRLAERVRKLVSSEPSDVIGAAARAGSTGSRASEPGDGDARLEVVLAVCRQFLDSSEVGPDTDVTVQGLTSLGLMRLAIALADAGVPVSVPHLVAARTPRAVSETSLSMPGPDPGPLTASSSGLERSRLERSRRARVVPDDMHEQSAIIVAEAIDPEFFERTLSHVAELVGVLDTRWEEGDPPSLRAAGAVEPVTVIECDTAETAENRSRDWLTLDLKRGYRPGDVLYRSALVRTSLTTTILTSWHTAVLDGWSTATLFRLLRDTYVALASGSAPPAATGAHVDDYRAWSAQILPGDDVWSEHLAGARWYHPVASELTAQATSSRRRIGSLAVPDTAGSASPMAVSVARVAAAARRALSLPDDEPLGIRTTLRSAQLPGSYDMIGQVTVDVPIRFDRAGEGDSAELVRAGLVLAWSHGHGGESAIRAAVRCPDAAELFRVLLVAEDEIPDDEWLVRHAGVDAAWREVSSWRRDVSPAAWTIYLRTGDGDLWIEVSTAAGDPDELCHRLAVDLRQPHETTHP
jgi:hypothetical protein